MIGEFKEAQKAISDHAQAANEMLRVAAKLNESIAVNEKFVADLDWKADRVRKLNEEIDRLNGEAEKARQAHAAAVHAYDRFKAELK